MYAYAIRSSSAFSSSPSDAEFDAVVGYLEDIIMGKLCKQLHTTRWVLKIQQAAHLVARLREPK